MRLRVNVEIEPAVFEEGALAGVGAEIVRRANIAWFTVEAEAGRLDALRALPGVISTLALPSCDDRLHELPADLAWEAIGAGDAHGLVAMRLEAGRSAGRVVALRLGAEVRALCFVRCHRTAGMDLAVYRPGAGARRPLARHSDGLRDQSRAGMHDWPAGTRRVLCMWVGHLPPGPAEAEAGFADGWIRVQGRPEPFSFTAPFQLG